MSLTRLLGTIFAGCLLGIVACATFVIDPSMDAVSAGDFTLVISACGAVPSGGMDLCQVTEGTSIESVWRLFPPAGKEIQDGEIDVYYRDIHKQYGILKGAKMIEIPWKDFFGTDKWDASLDGEVLALALVHWTDPQGLTQLLKLRGLAKIIVTKPGYDRIPIDSGFAAWPTTCKIVYSTAGRSAVSCK